MAAGDLLLRLVDVTKRYPGAVGAEGPPVLDRVGLELKAGESLAVMGPSGCGKTTLLNCIGTLDQPDSGTLELDGRDLTSLSTAELAEVRNRQIGFVFQLHHLLPQCTVWENVLLPTLASQNEVLRDGAPDRAQRLLKRVGLEPRLKHRPGQLSGGERQRVAVVRALINEPQLLLADEPTGALDHASAEQLAQLLVELNHETGITLIVVTHSMELAGRMERVMTLRDGRLNPAETTP
ncbi:MAG: ABC transporter ATP-binding protein [Verrucomicrobiae bacterium]|nr:ABC transporter ATP-binding protein [Verrucomicrobiae bacterium]MCP5523085.1 ABC transporter ATP-binding protein [Verrucomicrobiales bacterium]